MCLNSEGYGKTEQMHRLAWAFAGRLCDKYQLTCAFASRLCDKYHNLMSWLIWLY